MVLYIIGLGLWDSRDITLRGLEAIRNCSRVYIDNYTSFLSCEKKELERLYGKPVLDADRQLLEENSATLLEEARSSAIALLVAGDPLAATTHLSLVLSADEQGIPVEIIHNASVLTAVAVTGLELYKFGRTASIPRENNEVTSPFDIMQKNLALGLHTLFLLDLSDRKSMTVADAAHYLLRIGLDKKKLCIGCAALGSPSPQIVATQLEHMHSQAWTLQPQCMIVPGELHFVEKQALRRWSPLTRCKMSTPQ